MALYSVLSFGAIVLQTDTWTWWGERGVTVVLDPPRILVFVIVSSQPFATWIPCLVTIPTCQSPLEPELRTEVTRTFNGLWLN